MVHVASHECLLSYFTQIQCVYCFSLCWRLYRSLYTFIC